MQKSIRVDLRLLTAILVHERHGLASRIASPRARDPHGCSTAFARTLDRITHGDRATA